MCAEVDTDDEMNRVLEDFKVSPDGGLKDVVVTLEHVDAGKPFNKEPINITAENCKFLPDVNVIRQGESFKIDNIDAVMHNSQVYQKERGKMWEFKKTKTGGVSRIPLPFFTVFNMGDPPTINVPKVLKCTILQSWCNPGPLL